MAIPTGQVDSSKTFGTGLSEYYNKNLNKATTASFVTQLQVNVRGLRQSVFVIHNNGAGDLDYEILATIEESGSIVDPTGTNDDNKGWLSLKSGSIATGIKPVKHALKDSWTRVLVRIKHTTATTNVDLRHRGQN